MQPISCQHPPEPSQQRQFPTDFHRTLCVKGISLSFAQFFLLPYRFFLQNVLLIMSDKKGLFQPCKTCGKKRVHADDPHKDCIYCLHPAHEVKQCKICRTFSSKTLRDREGRLLLRLQSTKHRKTSEEESDGSPRPHKRARSLEKDSGEGRNTSNPLQKASAQKRRNILRSPLSLRLLFPLPL